MDITQNIISNQIRYDLEVIALTISDNSKVIDIGCGNGELLSFLKKHKNANVSGIEICPKKASEALSNGISVIQGDALKNLQYYPDNSFDYAILSQTIQAMKEPKTILQEMLRIANKAIISLPNFAYIKNRLHLLIKGRMPVNKNIPFQWYDTPNIHFCSIIDFEKLCLQLNFNIENRFFLTNIKLLPKYLSNDIMANLLAQYGIFVISKDYYQANSIKIQTANTKNISLVTDTCYSDLKIADKKYK